MKYQNRHSTALAIACLAIALGTSIGHAAGKGEIARPPSSSISKASLAAKGFKCELVTAGWYECTDGTSVYWCVGWTCVRKNVSATGRQQLSNPSTTAARSVNGQSGKRPDRAAKRLGATNIIAPNN
jgi:hypothetical protein